MKIEKMDKKGRTLKVLVKDSNPAMMNAIRRISMKSVPVLAIEDVGVIENSSPLFDEIIAQRLGQVPIDFEPEEFDIREDCDCEDGCPNCEATFSLEVEDPGTVHSEDIVCESGDVEPLHDEIPITELDENQRIEMEATAIVSTGDDHSKHQASISSYQYYPIIDIDNRKLDDEEKKKAAEVCPRDVLEVKNGKLKVLDETRCTLCKECMEEVSSEGIVITGDEEKFILKVEPISALSPEYIIEKTAEILEDKADRIIDKLS